MIYNKLRQQYRQTVGNLRIEFKDTCLYRLCEEVVKRLSKILDSKEINIWYINIAK